MNQAKKLNIKKALLQVNMNIEECIILLETKGTADLNLVNKQIKEICQHYLILSEEDKDLLKEDLNKCLINITYLKSLLQEQLQSINVRIKKVNQAIAVSKRYNYAANNT